MALWSYMAPDTMAYTASALSFMLEDLRKPVMVTGSQIPLSQLRSDGRAKPAQCALCRRALSDS